MVSRKGAGLGVYLSLAYRGECKAPVDHDDRPTSTLLLLQYCIYETCGRETESLSSMISGQGVGA